MFYIKLYISIFVILKLVAKSNVGYYNGLLFYIDFLVWS